MNNRSTYQIIDKISPIKKNSIYLQLLRAFMYIGLVMIITACNMPSSNQTKNFDDGYISLIYPNSWSEQEMTNIPLCNSSNDSICHIFIQERGIYPTNIYFQTIYVDQMFGDAQEVGEQAWLDWLNQTQFEGVEHGTYPDVAGKSAYYFTYNDNLTHSYNIVVILALGNSYFIISISAPSKEQLEQDQSIIDSILNSLVIKSDG